MTVEAVMLPDEEVEAGYDTYEPSYLEWTPVVAGAFCAAAFSFVLFTFAVAVGLGVSSTSPTWRDTSIALTLLSGIYLIFQALVSFGIGGYIAGRARATDDAPHTDEVERRDGLHGLAMWALAVLLGALLVTLVAASTPNKASLPSANATSAEPLLSYEIDRLLRSPRRSPNVDISSERAEAGRILLTSSSHNGVSSDDRAYLVQQVGAVAGLSPADAERRVDSAIANAKTAIEKSRRSAIVLAFSVAAATLLGAVVAWLAACAGGRHRDGEPLPEWMRHWNKFERRRAAIPNGVRG
jgi:hypothetical protein